MKNKMQILGLFFAFCFVSGISAQTITLSGTVTDDQGEALIGASIFLEEFPNVGTITDLDGTYSLEVEQQAPFTLVASYTGYSRSTTTVEGSGQYDFTLSMDALGLDEIVVTGVVNAKSKLESSVSITTLKPEAIFQTTPRVTSEIFRTIPGIRSESSGGDGNANITVRGVPISSGGSKYLQLQEDGLPIFLFGDIAFATADIFLRSDANLARIEAIRGGSASTLSSNSPAGIINFISKTGSIQGGSVSSTFGLDYNSFRTDFDYGAPISDDLSFHVGGFFRSGDGPRHTGYTANQGGQIKANLTKRFGSGYARVYFKHLNDRAAGYLPMPMRVTGTADDPTWESLDGFSATRGSQHSTFLQSNFGLGANGERRLADVADGMHPVSNAIGTEFQFELGDGWEIESRTRLSQNSGRFVAPFTAAVGTTADMLTTIEGAIGRDLTGANLTYAHNGEAYNGELSQVIHMFDTELNNFNTLFSDTKVSKSFGNVTASVGFFKGDQNIDMAWLWNSYLMEVKGENAALIDITTTADGQITESGQFAYGVPVWGNCCQRRYSTLHSVNAPYASVEIEANENLTLDASFRYDFGDVSGFTLNGVQAELDVNNDGIIAPIEESVSVIDQANNYAVDWDYDFASYSIGANYKLNNKQAVFARFSHGGSAKADRILTPGAAQLFVGNPKDVIDQAELGWKQKFNAGGLFITGFYAKTTEEGGFEATTQRVIDNDYSAVGLEIEGAFNFGDLDLRGALTYTNASINSGDNDGNTPRRQPDLMFNIIPTYSLGKSSAIGLSIIGQTKAYAQDDNVLVMPGFAIVNGFVSFGITEGLSFSINANNLFDSIGLTESEDGAMTNNQVNYLRARPVAGRSISGSIRYNF